MDFTTWLSLVAICCLGAMSPGPSLAVVLRHTMNSGRAHGVLSGTSHAGGVALWAVVTMSGLAVLLSQSPILHKALTYAGAGYLAWIGMKSLMATEVGALKVEGGGASLLGAAKDGAMISLLNPKLAIFFIALFSQFVSADMATQDQAIIVGTVTFIDGAWYALVAIILSQSQILTRLQRKAATINRVCGVVLLLLAVRVVTL